MRNALIVRGGWDGHEPEKVSLLFRDLLEEQAFTVRIADDLDVFLDEAYLTELDLIIPHYTMSKISDEQAKPVMNAVAAGVGLAGIHGGMCDAFREHVGWQFMTGGQWVAHPGNDGVEHRILIKPTSSPITEGLPDFTVKTEHYYLHVDPAVEVLAVTRFPVVDGPHASNGPVDMPVAWTKRWGKGRVFYCSLGHHADVIEVDPARTLLARGFAWAAAGRVQARSQDE